MTILLVLIAAWAVCALAFAYLGRARWLAKALAVYPVTMLVLNFLSTPAVTNGDRKYVLVGYMFFAAVFVLTGLASAAAALVGRHVRRGRLVEREEF